ncbi:MAG: TetR/AcrR family transcriptional regulator [Marinobacter sp.]|nr:TetR/AcrR family transcriptional regulator [Marinobacter sp.]
MATRTTSSRERILATAESLILQKGYVGTSIEDILDKAAITKGGFFYHFNGKIALAHALVNRYLEQDQQIFGELLARADSLSEDPLQRVLIFLNLLSEMVSGMTATHPGCLVAAFTYEMQQFDEETRQRMAEGVMEWRALMADRLAIVAERYPARIPVSIESLADMFASSVEGGIVLARVLDDNRALVGQVQAYRSHIRLIFDPSVALGAEASAPG